MYLPRSFYPLLCLLSCLITGFAAAAPTPAEHGRQLYEFGIGHDGKPIKARDENGNLFAGEGAACLRCHRRSGFGGSEGGFYVPPITSNYVYEPSRSDRNDRFRAAFLEAQNTRHWMRARMPRSRPAYTLATLGDAIRNGHNPAGTKFELMPRYEIDDEDLANVAAYLHELSKEISPGVDEDYIHLATVIGPGVDPAERDAMLVTTRAFVAWYNERLRADMQHKASGRAYGMQFRESTRLWQLHVWQLEGDGDSWNEQLQRHQQERPVFAMINALVAGPWAPVAQFCDTQRLPCLFPLTELPDSSRELGGYSVYYSRGLELEADVLAHYLSRLPDRPREIIQLHHARAGGQIAAKRFARIAAERLPSTAVHTVAFENASQIETALEKLSADGVKAQGVVVWPDERLEAFTPLLGRADLATVPVYTCSRVLDALDAAAADASARKIASRLTVVWPYTLPDARPPDAYRARAWMRSRGVAVTNERLQFMSYYSMGILRDSLRHMFEHFHRDYLIERIEHEVDGAQNPGFYPTLALGPEQRVLSKGGYVVRLQGEAGRGIVPASDWIIP